MIHTPLYTNPQLAEGEFKKLNISMGICTGQIKTGPLMGKLEGSYIFCQYFHGFFLSPFQYRNIM